MVPEDRLTSHDGSTEAKLKFKSKNMNETLTAEECEAIRALASIKLQIVPQEQDATKSTSMMNGLTILGQAPRL